MAVREQVMGFISWFQQWSSTMSAGGFAAWVGLSLFLLFVLFAGFLYYALIKSSDYAKSLTRAAGWLLGTAFLSLMFIFFAIWG